MERITLPYGTIRTLAERTGVSEVHLSNVLAGHRLGSYELACALDETGLIPTSMKYRWTEAKKAKRISDLLDEAAKDTSPMTRITSIEDIENLEQLHKESPCP